LRLDWPSNPSTTFFRSFSCFIRSTLVDSLILLGFGLDPRIWLLKEEEDDEGVDKEVRVKLIDMDEDDAMDRLLAAVAATAAEGVAPLPLPVPSALSVKSESSVRDNPTDQSTSNTVER
jgi:hypothetical protein